MPGQPTRHQGPSTPDRPFDVEGFVEEGLATAAREQGALNVALAGKAGAGRSTLVDAMFGGQRASTAARLPGTRHVTRHRCPDRPLTIYGTPGADPGSAAEVAADYRTVVRANADDPADRMHFALYCVRTADGRLDGFQADLVRSLAEELLVVLVLTQCPSPHDEGVTGFSRQLTELRLPVLHGRPFPTLALGRRVAGTTLAPFGLPQLVEAVGASLDAATQPALASFQQVSLELKRAEARRVIASTVALASGVALTPIPVVDALPIGALQLRMLGRISVAMGFDADPGAVSTGILDGSGATPGVAGFLTVFPGVGTVVDVPVAAATTRALGEAFLAACTTLLRRRSTGADVRPDDLTAELARQLDDVLRRPRRPRSTETHEETP